MDSTNATLNYCSEIHQSSTFFEFNQLRSCQELCDVILNIGSKKIAAHRIILAASSSYFRNMFTMSMAESQQREINIHGVDEVAIEIIIDFFYTSKITINNSNVISLITTADYIQLMEIKEICCSFFKQRINLSNCLEIFSLVTSHSCLELMKIITKFIGNNFQEIMYTNEFRSLPLQQVKSLISSNHFNVRSEEFVFDAIMEWVEWKDVHRRTYLYELLQCVQLPLLGSEILMKKIVANRSIISDNNCRKLLNSAKSYLLKQQPAERGPRTRLNYSPSQFIFVIGGYCNNKAMSSVESYNPDIDYWKIISPLKTPRYGLGVTASNNKIYAIGGHNGSDILNNMEVYDLESNRWSTEVSLMNSGRTSIGVAALNGILYAVGGQNKNSFLNYAELYDPGKDTWYRIASMTTERVGVAAVALNNCIYAIGGSCEQSTLSTAEKYDPRANKWIQMASMSSPRKHFGCTTVNEQIYVVGGSDNNTELSSVEVYDPRSESWFFTSRMAFNRAGISVVTIDNEIYVIGGNNGTSNLNTVDIFNTVLKEWRPCCTKTNFERFGSAACSLNMN